MSAAVSSRKVKSSASGSREELRERAPAAARRETRAARAGSSPRTRVVGRAVAQLLIRDARDASRASARPSGHRQPRRRRGVGGIARLEAGALHGAEEKACGPDEEGRPARRWCRCGGTRASVVPARLRKNSLAFIRSCWNVHGPLPVKRLAPCRVTSSMLPPPLRPCAAEVSAVCTSTSSSASSGTPRLPPRPPEALSRLVVSMPFTRSELLVGRAPFTLGLSDCDPSSACAAWLGGEVQPAARAIGKRCRYACLGDDHVRVVARRRGHVRHHLAEKLTDCVGRAASRRSSWADTLVVSANRSTLSVVVSASGVPG